VKKKLRIGGAMLAVISGAAMLAPRPVPQPPAAKAAMRAPTSCKQAKRALRRYLHRLHVGYCHRLIHHPSWHYFDGGRWGWTVIAYYKGGPYGGKFFKIHAGVW
jgi:hypothetical protein